MVSSIISSTYSFAAKLKQMQQYQSLDASPKKDRLTRAEEQKTMQKQLRRMLSADFSKGQLENANDTLS